MTRPNSVSAVNNRTKTNKYIFSEDTCPGHIAAPNNSKICARCGIHIDSLRPPEENESC